MTVFIGLGSNLEHPVTQLDKAIKRIEEDERFVLKQVASYYQSPALVLENTELQPDYINTVIQIETQLSCEMLLDVLQSIETQQGRVRTKQRWQARTLDLDILLYGDELILNERLTVPHAGIASRAFVLYPLYELCPELRIPGLGVLADLIMQFEAEKTSSNHQGKAGSEAANLVKLNHERKSTVRP